MISFTDIEYAYPGAPKPIFRGLTLHLDSGSRLAVTGPDGSGKTTLAKLVTGLLKPMAGTITGDSAFPGRIAYLGGDPYDMIVGLSVEDDIVFGLENEALPSGEMEARLRDVLRWTGLEDLRHRLTHTLSGGEQQKLALAAALAMRVQGLVLDEALSMLDKPARTSIRSLIERLRHQLGMTVIEITNRPDDLFEADRIVVLESGAVRFDGTPNGFVSTPWGRGWCAQAGGTGGLAVTLIGNGVIPGTVGDSRDLVSYLLNNLLEQYGITRHFP